MLKLLEDGTMYLVIKLQDLLQNVKQHFLEKLLKDTRKSFDDFKNKQQKYVK